MSQPRCRCTLYWLVVLALHRNPASKPTSVYVGRSPKSQLASAHRIQQRHCEPPEISSAHPPFEEPSISATPTMVVVISEISRRLSFAGPLRALWRQKLPVLDYIYVVGGFQWAHRIKCRC